MGPINIKITTTQLQESQQSEYGSSEPSKIPEKDEYGSTEPPKNTETESEVPDIINTSVHGGKNNDTEGLNENYTYEGSECFYKDPSSGVKFRWCKDSNEWVDAQSGKSLPPSSDTHTQEEALQQNYRYDGDTYIYTDKLSGKRHKWNTENNSWEEMEGVAEEEQEEESEEDENTTEEERKARQYRKRKAAPGWDDTKYEKDPETGATIYKDPNDGVVYELDADKNAWFPRLDEEFMAIYQLNYGFTKDGVAQPTKPEEPDPLKDLENAPEASANKKGKKEEKKPPSWFEEDESKSCKVYVSNLPLEMTEEEFEALMSKCGMVEHDPVKKKPKVKLYMDGNNQPKGDGLCTYIKPESVQLALTILDGSLVEGKTISVQRAKFQLKGEYDPSLKPKKLTKKQMEKAKKSKERLFAWAPEKLKGEMGKHEKVIVIKNMFTVEELDRDPGLIIDYSNNIRTQCSKFGGVAKVILHDKHKDGVCQVHFKDPSEAHMAVEMLNGRLFGKRVMDVSVWDGRTKYKVEESTQDEEERLQKWEEYLKESEKSQESETEDNPKTGELDNKESDLHMEVGSDTEKENIEETSAVKESGEKT